MKNEMTFDVERTAGLAQLALTPDEASRLDGELRQTLAWLVETLRAVDVEGVEPTVYGVAEFPANTLREDVPQPTLDREAVLQQAPERLGDEFKMPRIVE